MLCSLRFAFSSAHRFAFAVAAAFAPVTGVGGAIAD